MKILSVQTDINKYQLILPLSDSDEVYDMLDFNGNSKLNIWKPLTFFIDNPLNRKADFFSFIGSSAFACNKLATDKLMRFWSLSAELLPINLEDGTELFIVNVIDCVNALDQENVEYDYYDDGSRSNRILKYSFHKNRFHESSIFKIPETAKTQILTYVGVKTSEDEFYTAYNQSGLEGLVFKELYSTD